VGGDREQIGGWLTHLAKLPLDCYARKKGVYAESRHIATATWSRLGMGTRRGMGGHTFPFGIEDRLWRRRGIRERWCRGGHEGSGDTVPLGVCIRLGLVDVSF
jgi:hypothetical protein